MRVGDTQALVSLSGPIEVRPNSELPSQATVEVHIRPLASVPGTDSKTLAATVKSILTPVLLLSHHPRTLIQIVGQALCSSDGVQYGSATRGWHPSLVASVINATSAALINTGSIPMKGVVCAVAVGRSVASGTPVLEPTLLLDPSEAELPTLAGGGCFVYMFSSTLSGTPAPGIPQCSLLWTNYAASSGTFGQDELNQARLMAQSAARRIWRELKRSVEGTPPASASSEGGNQGANTSSEVSIDDERMEI